jgi:hypothetical protein
MKLPTQSSWHSSILKPQKDGGTENTQNVASLSTLVFPFSSPATVIIPPFVRRIQVERVQQLEGLQVGPTMELFLWPLNCEIFHYHLCCMTAKLHKLKHMKRYVSLSY